MQVETAWTWNENFIRLKNYFFMILGSYDMYTNVEIYGKEKYSHEYLNLYYMEIANIKNLSTF